MTEIEQQAQRLKELLSAIKVNQSGLAVILGVTRGYVSMLLKGGKPMSQMVINKISACFPKVNINWLLSGNGAMFIREEGVKVHDPEPGMLTGVMEEPGGYERSGHTGIVETTMDRVSALEAQVATLLERMEWLEGEVRRLGGGCPGGDDAG